MTISLRHRPPSPTEAFPLCLSLQSRNPSLRKLSILLNHRKALSPLLQTTIAIASTPSSPPRSSSSLRYLRAVADVFSSPPSSSFFLLFQPRRTTLPCSSAMSTAPIILASPSPSASTSHRNLPFLAEPVSTSSLNHLVQPPPSTLSVAVRSRDHRVLFFANHSYTAPVSRSF
ncbi:uncharacterized protein DS421_18g623050 [Arachis hypogaea]|nr:uncharacterized protein DS421_18g623050 [Arachis hypogaea]